MCGIAGLYQARSLYSVLRSQETAVRRMIQAITYRGPDAEGIWADQQGRCVLGHRRLSIIDTSAAGRQPMVGNDGRWIITFNGEIYNFHELRRELEAEGEKFRGRTDTEVLLAAIAKWGVEILPRLDGMFAFAAFNRESGEILLARDPFGEKPLYYLELPGGGLAFASELHCLEQLPGFDAELSLDAMAEVLMFQYIGAPRTIYRSVRKLRPGHWLKLLPEARSEAGRYFEFVPGRDGFDRRPISDLADELEDILLTSLRRRLISDVPLGAFLSGGVDSSTVCALIQKRLNGSLTTFSMGFEGAEESEHETARQFAAHLHTDHHDRVLRPDTAHFLEDIGSVLDEPNADSSCMPTYFLSEFARRQVTVAISGDGGDEMFGGYGRYFDTLLEQRPEHRSLFAPSWAPGAAYYSGRILVFEPARIAALFGHVPDGLAQHLKNLRDEVDRSRNELLCALRKTDVENYMPGAVLPKVDRMSMRHSLEVRTPFLNQAVARFAERLPPEVMVNGRRGKLVLRELAYRYLPKHLIDMPKQGFGIPVSKWGKMELLSLAERKLKDNDSRLLDMLGNDRIERFLSHQRTNAGFSSYQLWGVVMLESWLRVHKAHLPRLSNDAPKSNVLRIGRSDPILSAVSIAPKIITVMPTEIASSLAEPCNNTEDRQNRDYLSKTVAELCCWLGPGYFEQVFSRRVGEFDARELSADTDLCKALRLAGFSLHRAILLVIDPTKATNFTPQAVNQLKKARLRALVYPHPHRIGLHFVRIQFNNKWSVHQFIDTMRLKARAIASWNMTVVRYHTGFCHVIGPLEDFPAVPNKEISHQLMMFEGMKQLPPIPSSHEIITTDGGDRYSVWNRHIFFSVTKDQNRPESAKTKMSKIFWVVENTPDNSPLLPMTAQVSESKDLPDDNFVLRLESYFNVRKQRHATRLLHEVNSRRILVITHALTPGGAERQWCYLAIGLKRLGFEVIFATYDWLDGELAHYRELLTNENIEPYELGRIPIATLMKTFAAYPDAQTVLAPDGTPFGIRLVQLVSLLNEIQPTAIFAQLDAVNILAGIAGTIAGTPKIVFSFRNVNPTNFSYLRNDWFLPAYRVLVNNQGIILSGNSRAGNNDYAQWIGVPPESVKYVGNAIENGTANRPLPVGPPDVVPSVPSILGVFRLSEEKRPLLFLEICERVKSVIPSLQVLIAGVGPMQAELTAEIRKRGASDYVKLLGRRNDVLELMQLSSLLLLTSVFEGTPNVVLEAQALGVPVIATSVGGVPDVVINGETGFLTGVNDKEALAQACIRILSDERLRIRMGEAARTHVAKLFTVKSMTDNYLELLQDVRSAPAADACAVATNFKDSRVSNHRSH